jgi:hypothetical protein
VADEAVEIECPFCRESIIKGAFAVGLTCARGPPGSVWGT